MWEESGDPRSAVQNVHLSFVLSDFQEVGRLSIVPKLGSGCETSSCSFACRVLEAFLTLRPPLHAVAALLLVGRRIPASVIELGERAQFRSGLSWNSLSGDPELLKESLLPCALTELG